MATTNEAMSTAPGSPMLSVIKSHDGKLVTVGDSVRIVLVAKSKDRVGAIYKKAIELGGKDEGPAGPRGDIFYAGYFRDLDGNKLNVFYKA